MTASQSNREPTADAIVERVFESVLGMLDGWSIYLGDKLGLYDVLENTGGCTRDQLASASGTDGRYMSEWLEQQVTTGFLDVDDPSLPADERRYSISSGVAEVMCDRDSLNYLAPFVRLVTAAGIQLPALLHAYRDGGGVSWAQFGEDMRTGQAEMNRPWFVNALGTDWFPAVDDLHQRLRQAGVKVADIGCGEGWSSIAIAAAYPHATVHGYDIDGPSVAAAREHAADAGVDDRVAFSTVDAATIEEGSYDVVTYFECVHDVPHPVEFLAAGKRLVKDDGHVIVMDEAVGDAFGERTDEVERLMYGFSLFVCLPDGMSHSPSAATGTVIRPDTMRRYAQQAGFSDIEILPIENDLWRFYRLVA